MTGIADIQASRLPAAALQDNFADAHPPLTRHQALVESDRCYFCHDAPCVKACPTGIDIPSFIRKIGTGNVKGAASDILTANIMGGMCSRVCPTEILCERDCVRNSAEEKPVNIGELQRYATDWLFANNIQLFQRAAATGKKVAIVGAGPAGLACAHKLATLGHDVTIFDAKPKAGGLNEYGLAAYKTPNDFAQSEIAYLLAVGGITIEAGKALGRDFTLADLRGQYDAVFLGLGLGGVNGLGVAGDDLAGVENAVDFIARLRQSDKASVPVGRRVVVIGGGNTAIDAAVQSKRLGAEEVTLVYRRGQDQMSATWVEREWAQTNGVTVRLWAQPVSVTGQDGAVTGVSFETTELNEAGKLVGTGKSFTLAADQVLKAIGQVFVPEILGGGADAPALSGGRIQVDSERRTSVPGLWAGGDCVAGGQDLTVAAVEDGKQAALSIHRALLG